ncbi:MAG: chromate transporter [Spirochaetia bacterium]|jgi:chromate transporter|nr:chromate transporter [Spirochaetales bacterium]MDX9783374.1 chromate transporter [Spirochaetia bacterium]
MKQRKRETKTDREKPRIFELFMLLARINAITLGGGYVIVPVMASSLEKKGWMSEPEFYDIFARAQAFPGPMALNSALLVAMKLFGPKGIPAAFLGVVLPPFIALILVSGLIQRYGSLPALRRFLDGAGAVVPGLIAAMIWKNASKRSWNIPRIIETGLLAVLLILLPRFSLPLLLLAIVIFYCIEGLCKSWK